MEIYSIWEEKSDNHSKIIVLISFLFFDIFIGIIFSQSFPSYCFSAKFQTCWIHSAQEISSLKNQLQNADTVIEECKTKGLFSSLQNSTFDESESNYNS